MNADAKAENQPARIIHLPGPLARFGNELARRYSMPPLVPVAMLLSAIGSAAGRKFQIDTGLGTEPVSPNLFYAVIDHPGSNLENVVSHILKPIRERQRASARR
jgi:hypothetical protein